MVDLHQNGSLDRQVVVRERQFFLNHFQNAVFERSPSELIFNQNQVVFCAFYVQNKRTSQGTLLVALDARKFRQLVYLLLGDDDGVFVVQAGQVNVLQGIVVGVYLVEYLPGHVEFNSLSDHFQLIPVLVLEILSLLERFRVILVELHIQFLFCLLHFGIENMVIFVNNRFVQLLILLNELYLALVFERIVLIRGCC